MTNEHIAPEPAGRNLSIIPEIGLTEIDGEPRARDIEVAERLGYSRPRAIRDLIKKNRAEIEVFGAVARGANIAVSGKGKETEVEEFWLTEEQALSVATLSKAPNAPAVRAMLIRCFVAWRRGHLAAPALPAEAMEMIRRDDGISRMLAHKVTEQGKALEEQNRALVVMADQMKALISIVRPSVPGVVIRHGRTAGAILKAAGIANCPRNFAKWFADRLEAAGCRVDGYVDTSVCRARLFDPDKAEQYLKNGGMAAVEKKLDERRGQGVLAFNVVRFPITAPLGKARHMSSRMWVEPVRGDNMSPTMMHMQDFVIARETNRYEGEGVYLLGRGEGGPYLQRACSALSGKREIQLSGDNPHYKPSVVTKEWFHENVVGFVVADIKVRDTRELPALHAVWSPAA